MDYWGGGGGGGGGKGMLAPLPNYWGGGLAPLPPPPLFLRLWVMYSLIDAEVLQRRITVIHECKIIHLYQNTRKGHMEARVIAIEFARGWLSYKSR